jgi:hypothetical protein
MCDQEPEAWGDDYADAIFEATPIYDDEIVNMLFFTQYRVTFHRLSPDYPPIDEIRAGIQGFSLEPFVQRQYPFMVFDFGRKLEIQDLISRGVYPPDFPLLYDMSIEIWGQDMYGQDFYIGPLIRVIEVADYNNC